MTAPTMMDVGKPSAVPPARPAGLIRVWLSSLGVYFWPGIAGRLWVSVSPVRAGVVAAGNFLWALPWLLVILVCQDAWAYHRLRGMTYGEYVQEPVRVFLGLFHSVPRHLYDSWREMTLVDKWALVLGVVVLGVLFLAMVFFVLLPLAARPGANKACVKHVLRTVLLGTGFVHIGSAATAATFLMLVAYRYPSGLENIIRPMLLVLSGLTLWGFVVLAYAARREYRRPEDYPQAHDPLCDACGYDLVAVPYGGRCPECGRLVADSLGAHVRNPTAWERRPVPWNLAVMVRQLAALVFWPRALFASMPTLTGQAAAQRWLCGALVLLAGAAFFIIPAFSWTGLYDIGWPNRLAGGLALALVWALLGLMMVGIETAGIATFSRMKGTPVSLATAAKVTAYSALLMLPWVFLGGAQLLGIAWWGDHWAAHYSIRMQQIVFTASLSMAHIGGLLWFEFTVYRGIRSVQFANQ